MPPVWAIRCSISSAVNGRGSCIPCTNRPTKTRPRASAVSDGLGPGYLRRDTRIRLPVRARQHDACPLGDTRRHRPEACR